MFNAILLMDLHWGAISPERMRQEIDEILFKYLDEIDNEVNKLDAIVIGGDLFDSKQYLSSDVTNYVIEFIDDLLRRTKKLGTYIYIILGTRTHDDLQLSTLKTIFRHKKRLIIMDTVTEVSLFHMPGEPIEYSDRVPDVWIPNNCGFESWDYCASDECMEEDERLMNILFIPEEYITDQKEYYKDTLYSNKKYDFIFGHGMIDKIWYAKLETQNELTKHSSSPVFALDDLCESANYTFFGHIHVHKRYGKNKNFEYVGPFTRWEFDKEEPVGFDYIEYDESTGICDIEFVENPLAQQLITHVINIQDEITLTEIDDKIETIISKDVQIAEKIRFIVNINPSIPNYLSIRDFLISKIGNIKFAKLLLSVGLNSDKVNEIENKVESDNITRRYQYEINVPMENNIKRYLKEKRGVDVSAEDISRVLKGEL